MNNIDSWISPRTIVLIGASENPEKVGHQILKNIVEGGFKGRLFGVNIKGGESLGIKFLPSVKDVDGEIDLAIIAVPSSIVKDVISDCAVKKVKGVIVITAGFSEVGNEGKQLEAEISSLCAKNGISLLGPNCLGAINTSINLNATFAANMPQKGHVSLLSQSGAIISSLIDISQSGTVGFSKIFSLGNKALLGEREILKYLYDDPETKVIAGYIESLVVDPELTKILLKYAKKKPTVLLFGGKSAFGAKAAKSHTGSVVSSYLAIRTYLMQAGIVIAENLEELLLFMRVFSSYNKIGGENVAIITNAGGPGIAASDEISAVGLKMAGLHERTKKQLEETFRKEAGIENPVDILGDASDIDYKKALEIVAKDSGVNGILLLLTPQTSTKISETAQVIASFSSDKPIVASFVGGEILSNAKRTIENASKPCFSFPEEAVLALKALADFSSAKQNLQLPPASSATFKPEHRDAFLRKFGLPIVEYIPVKNDYELQEAAEKIGFPVVLKTADLEAHKTDNGGVIVNIENAIELRKSALKIGYPAIVGSMIKGKFEILLGVRKDSDIGTSVLFGTGGIYSEIWNDFSHAIGPLTKEMAKDLINSTKIGQIMAGARGQKGLDLNELAEIIMKAVRFADHFANIKEVDFNPIIASNDGFHMVDVRIITN